MKKILWEDSTGGGKTLRDVGFSTISLHVPEGAEYLLNADIPKLIHAMYKHLNSLAVDHYSTETLAKLLEESSPEEIVKALDKACENNDTVWNVVLFSIIAEKFGTEKALLVAALLY